MNRPPRSPQLITDPKTLFAALAAARGEGRTIGLVPTMGALHAGHVSLVAAAQRECELTVVTVFVNPTQFAPGEDFDRYPRTLEADMAALAEVGTDLVFAPVTDVIYPPGSATSIDVGPIAARWEGECRPGHFRGVATIVLKLFHLAPADFAYFGRKDYQQAQVIRRMVADLNAPITVRVCPTVREPDGLAMSSRNRYLSADERQRARALAASLRLAAKLFAGGETNAASISQSMTRLLVESAGAKVDYVAITDPETLEPVTEVNENSVVLIAARIGKTRLIDNATLGAPPH